jgi:uncharacterized coiled-coil protein SlyX
MVQQWIRTRSSGSRFDAKSRSIPALPRLLFSAVVCPGCYNSATALHLASRVCYNAHNGNGCSARKAGYAIPAQEERLTTLEQSQAKFGDSINDLNHHVTILIGIIQKQEWDIREIKTSLRAIDGRLSSFDSRLGFLDSHLSSFERGVNSRFETLETRFGTQDKKLDQIMGLLTTLTTKSDQQT